MIGILTEKQCMQVLYSSLLGRLGCHNAKKIYVVPLSYVYVEGFIYAFSKEGLKIKMMRKSPKVCFQVDQIDDMNHWRSVIAWGTYEELSSSTLYETGIKIISEKFQVYNVSDSVKPVFISSEKLPIKEQRPVVYRIRINEISGRFEKNS